MQKAHGLDLAAARHVLVALGADWVPQLLNESEWRKNGFFDGVSI